MKKALFLLFTICSISSIAGTFESKESDSIKYSISPDDKVLTMIDSLMAERYYERFGFCLDTIGELAFDSVPPLVDSLLEQRMMSLNANTPFDLKYNKYTKAFINLYVNKRRKLSRSVLALAPLYFPMIEETLDRFDMPLELKYLAVVESALNPCSTFSCWSSRFVAVYVQNGKNV